MSTSLANVNPDVGFIDQPLVFSGWVAQASWEPAGAVVVGDTAAGATTLVFASEVDVGDVLAFGDGDTVTVSAVSVDQYTATLAAALPHNKVDGDFGIFQPLNQRQWVYVQTNEDDDPIYALMPYGKTLPDGPRAPSERERVLVTQSDEYGDWVVVDVLGVDYVAVTAAALPPPSVVTDLLPPASSPTAVLSSGVGCLFASWTAITNHDPVTYEVHLGTASGFAVSSGTKVGEVSGTMFQITTLPGGGALVAGTNYYARIVAKDNDGSAAAGVTSGAAQITVITTGTVGSDGIVPSVVPAPTVANMPGVGLTASWTPSTNTKDLVQYEVHLSTASGFTPGAGTLLGTTAGSSWVIRRDAAGAALVGGTTYYVKIIAKDVDGAAAASAQTSQQFVLVGSADILDGSIATADVAANAITLPKTTLGNIDNAVPDPSFELGSAEWSISGEWSRVTGDAAGAHTGTSYARKNSGYTASNGPFTNNYQTATDTDLWYLEVWAWHDASVVTAPLNLYVFCYDSANTYLGPKTIPGASGVGLQNFPASTWVKFAGVTPLLPGTNKIRFACYINPNAGEVRLDDFYATRAGLTADRLVMGNFDNLCENPGFEAGNVSWLASTSPPPSNGWSLTNDPANAHYGNWVATRTAQAAASALKNINTPDCKPGDQFYGEVWAKGDGTVVGTVYVRITWINAAGAEITYSQAAAITPGTTYTLIAVTGTAPANAVRCRIDPVAANTAGQVWFDDVYLHRVLVTPFIADQAIITAKIADAALTTAKFASGIRPVTIVSALPANPYTGYVLGDAIVNTTDGKLYRMTNLSGAGTTGWSTAVPTVDLTGTISNTQIAAGAVDATKFASGLRPVGIVSALPANPYTGYVLGDIVTLTTDGKVYRMTNLSGAGTSGWSRAVDGGDLSAGTVPGSAIVADSITAGQIAAGAITASELAANSVYTAALQAGAVTAATIAANTITAAQIAANTITAAQIAANTITAAQIAADTITAGQIAAGAITSSELAAGAVIAGKIAAGVVTATEIAANTITAGQIAAGTITATQIATDTITANQIAANAITSSELAANAVVAGKIAANAVTAGTIAAGAVTAGTIAADAVTANEIAAGAVNTSELAAGAVTAVKVTAGTLTSNEIAALTIVGGNIAAQTVTASKIVVDDVLASNIMAIQMQASMIATASSGQRVVLDVSGLTAYDSTNNPTVSFPTDPGQDAYIKATIDAITLNVLQGLVMKGTSNILESGAILTLRNGIKASASKPVLKVVWPDRVALPVNFDPSGNQAAVTAFEYSSSGFGAQPTYLIGWMGNGTDGSTQYQVVEYKAADMTQLRLIKDWGWGICHGLARDSTQNVYVLTRFVNAFNLTKYDNTTSPAAQLANRDISADFPNATWGGLFLAGDNTTLYIFEAAQNVNWQTAWRYATVTLSNAGAWTKSATTTLATITSNIFTAKDFEVAESRIWMTMTDDPVNGTITTSWTTAGVQSSNFDFTGPGALTNFTHDGTTFRSVVGNQIILHSAWVWTTASAKYWVGFTWHEDTGPSPSGTWTNVDLESGESPISSITMIRRAKLSVTVSTLPNPYSAGGVMYASVYMNIGASDPGAHKRQGFGSNLSTQTLATYDSAGPLRAAAGEGVFPSGANAALQSDDGSPLLRANGFSRMRTQHLAANMPKSIANNTVTDLNIWRQATASGDTDTDSYFALAGNTAIKLPFVGTYLMVVHTPWAAGTITGYRRLNIQQSSDGGTNWTATSMELVEAAAPTGNSMNLVGVYTLSALGSPDTRVKVVAQHTDGAALNIVTTCYWSIIYLGPV